MKIIDFIRELYQRYKKAEIQTRSAALAYHTLLAVVPILGLLFLYLRKIGLSKNWFNLTKAFLLSQMNVNSDSRLIQVFDSVTQNSPGHAWGWVGLAVVAYTAWNLIDKFGHSLDIILHTSDESHIVKRGFLKLFVRRIVMALVFPVGLMIPLAMGQWVRKDSPLRHLIGFAGIVPYITLPLAWTADIVALFLLYFFLPRSRIPPREAFKAALIAGPSAEIVKYTFGRYSRYAVAMHRIYGIFVIVPLFILWVQIAWMIVLGGALAIRFPKKSRPNPL